MKPITDDTRIALVQWLDNQDVWSAGRLLVIHDRNWWQGDRGDFRRLSYWIDYITDAGARGLALGPVTLWWEPSAKDGTR